MQWIVACACAPSFQHKLWFLHRAMCCELADYRHDFTPSSKQQRCVRATMRDTDSHLCAALLIRLRASYCNAVLHSKHTSQHNALTVQFAQYSLINLSIGAKHALKHNVYMALQSHGRFVDIYAWQTAVVVVVLSCVLLSVGSTYYSCSCRVEWRLASSSCAGAVLGSTDSAVVMSETSTTTTLTAADITMSATTNVLQTAATAVN
eukprot:15792-Heterococcus_DN1.PRE.7